MLDAIFNQQYIAIVLHVHVHEYCEMKHTNPDS